MAKILVLFKFYKYPMQETMHNELFCFKRYSNHKIYYVNCLLPFPRWIKKTHFDSVIFTRFLTFGGDRESYRKSINDYHDLTKHITGKRIAMFQDEFCNTDIRVEFLNNLNIDIVFSVAPESEWPLIYKGIKGNVRIYRMLTGYIEDRHTVPYAKLHNKIRDIDVGYRVNWDVTRICLGLVSRDKQKIAECFLHEKKEQLTGFNINIKTGIQFTIFGKKWLKYLRRCRFMLGTESSADVLDTDASIMANVNEYYRKNPQADWQEIYDLFVREHDHTVNLCNLSPRHFEAIQAGSCQILYEGDYSGVLKPYIHYVPLKKDHSNFNEVLKILSDEDTRKAIVERAYNDIVMSGDFSYSGFVEYFFSIVSPSESQVKSKDRLVLIWSYLAMIMGFVRLDIYINLYIPLINSVKKVPIIKKILYNVRSLLNVSKYA